MQEFKFRGIGLDTEKWVFGYGVIVIGDEAIIVHKQGNNMMQHTAVKKDTVGQYTGLPDIASEDCYDGDIVRAVWSENINDEIFGIGKVVFVAGCWMIQWLDDPEADMELLGMVHKPRFGRLRFFKILGNMHEHPEELLKQHIKP